MQKIPGWLNSKLVPSENLQPAETIWLELLRLKESVYCITFHKLFPFLIAFLIKKCYRIFILFKVWGRNTFLNNSFIPKRPNLFWGRTVSVLTKPVAFNLLTLSARWSKALFAAQPLRIDTKKTLDCQSFSEENNCAKLVAHRHLYFFLCINPSSCHRPL